MYFFDFIKTTGKLSGFSCFAAGHDGVWKRIDECELMKDDKNGEMAVIYSAEP